MWEAPESTMLVCDVGREVGVMEAGVGLLITIVA